MEKALAVLSSAHSLSSNDSDLKAKVASVLNTQRTFPLHPPPPFLCPLQCTYSVGRCLHLLSKCASPDPELQWRVGECEECMGEEGRRLGEGTRHSTLSTIMRREEANQAEVSVYSSPCHEGLVCMCDNQRNIYYNCYCSKLHCTNYIY